jgi:ferrous iron transport protein A
MQSVQHMTQGSSGQLVRVEGERSFRRRLMELGFLPGTRVRLVRRVDLGDLVELEVRGGLVSLRCSEAALLYVESPNA